MLHCQGLISECCTKHCGVGFGVGNSTVATLEEIERVVSPTYGPKGFLRINRYTKTTQTFFLMWTMFDFTFSRIMLAMIPLCAPLSNMGTYGSRTPKPTRLFGTALEPEIDF